MDRDVAVAVKPHFEAYEVKQDDLPSLEAFFSSILADSVPVELIREALLRAQAGQAPPGQSPIGGPVRGRLVAVADGAGHLMLVPFHISADASGHMGLPIFHARSKNREAAILSAGADRIGGLGAETLHILVSPGNRLEAVLAKAGFASAGTIIDMSRSAPVEWPGDGRRWTTYSRARRALFADVFYRTLEGSLDCAEIPVCGDGDRLMRAFEERGEFAPEDFTLLEGEAGPEGILLAVDMGEALDIAYVGVVPRARRRGLGKLLVSRAMERAAERRLPRITVSVDSRNLPAITLYEQFAFSENRAVCVYYRLQKNF